MKKKNTKNMRNIRKVTKIKKPHISPKLRGASKKVATKESNKVGVIPLNDRVLVRPFDPEEMVTTSSGIIIPDTVSKEKPEQGEVIAVGEGKWEGGKRVPPSVKIGDKVVFSKYGYDDVKLKGVEYYILREDSILAIIKN